MESFKEKNAQFTEEIKQLRQENTQLNKTQRHLLRTEQQLASKNRMFELLSQCNKLLLRANDEISLTNKICTLLVEVGNYRLAWIGFAEKNNQKSVTPVASAGFEDGYLETLKISWADTARGRGPTGSAIRLGKAVISHNIWTNPEFKPWRQQAKQRGYQSSIALPLKVEKQVVGALNIYASQPDAFDKNEVKLLREMANDLAFGLQTLRDRTALIESEQRYHQLFQASPDAVFVLDSDGRILDCNQVAEKRYGYSREELLTMFARDLAAPDLRRHAGQKLKQALKSGATFEWRHQRKESSLLFVEINAKPFALQRQSCIVLSVRDISERKNAQLAQLESEQRWTFALEGIGDGVWDWNAQTNEVFFSKRWKEMLGFEEHEIANSLDEWSKRVHPDDLGWVTEEINKHFRGERAVYISEHRMLCKDGTYKWILERGKVMTWTADGKPLRVVGTHEDISERKRVENELRESTEKFQAFFENSMDGILLTAPDGSILSANPAACDMLGRTEKEICELGRTGLVDTSDPRLTELLAERKKSGKTSGELTMYRKNGAPFPVEMSSALFKDKQGNIRTSMIIRDITERSEALEKLRRWKQIFEHAQWGIAVSSQDGKTLELMNPAYATMHGFSVEELTGTPMFRPVCTASAFCAVETSAYCQTEWPSHV